jgi:hypothetical protein
MRFSSAIFVLAVAAVSNAAAIPKRNVAQDVEARAPVPAPVAVPAAAAGYKRQHARDFARHARRDPTEGSASSEPVGKREADVPVIQVYKRVHARDFPKREVNATVKREVVPEVKVYKRLHARDFTSFKNVAA